MVDDFGPEGSLDQEIVNINDLFWTFQGEGLHWGRRALFVRMPFCNLACSWCDTSFNTYQKFYGKDVKAFAKSEASRFAVITGGEPMMNKHTPMVVALLKECGFELACETNGTFPIVDGIDFVTVSPKRDAKYEIHPQVRTKVNELKLVVDAGFDFTIAEMYQNALAPHVRLSLSPEYNELRQNIERIMKFVKENPRWRISLQTHKWMQIP